MYFVCFVVSLHHVLPLTRMERVAIIEHYADLPQLPGSNYFHSRELMELCEQTPRHKPYMAVVTTDDGTVVAHLLAIMRYRNSWFPPYLYTHVHIYGENGSSLAHFSLMIEALTTKLQNRTLYIELSNLSQKLFAYRTMRQNGFFPVRWMSIHNSLHSRTPEERISPKLLKRIGNAQQRGITTKLVETDEEFRAFSRLLHRHNWFKPRHYIPHDDFFRGMLTSGRCRIFISKIRQTVIGCSVCVYSGSDAYLWYTASLRKSYPILHPNAVTIWETIKHAYANGYDHIRFFDVGLPFRKTPYRDFILRYGGKEVSTYRWFRISIRWVNALASWLWRE